MRSNSGHGKCNNNLLGPSMKEHEGTRTKLKERPAHGRAERATDVKEDQPQGAESGPID